MGACVQKEPTPTLRLVSHPRDPAKNEPRNPAWEAANAKCKEQRGVMGGASPGLTCSPLVAVAPVPCGKFPQPPGTSSPPW